MPGETEREQIWRVQVHPAKTPLADDVDFRELARRYAVSGGDIRNAVLKAALTAASAQGPDVAKRIHQRDFEVGIEDVIAGKRVMQQSLFANDTRQAIVENPLAVSLVASHRLLIIALAVAGAALITAIAAFVVALAQ